MAYNDGWRVYENIPMYIQKRSILIMAKNRYIRQLNTQQKKVTKASDKTRLLTLENSSYARRVTADLRLSAECESRDRIQQRIDIIEKWMEEFENER